MNFKGKPLVQRFSNSGGKQERRARNGTKAENKPLDKRIATRAEQNESVSEPFDLCEQNDIVGDQGNSESHREKHSNSYFIKNSGNCSQAGE